MTRRALASTVAATTAAMALAACSVPSGGISGGSTTYDEGSFGCQPDEGVSVSPETLRQRGSLAVGEVRLVTFVVGPLKANSCGPKGREFHRVDWMTDINSSHDPVVQARLHACDACTLQFEGRPGEPRVAAGPHGAALLQRGTQLVTLELKGLHAGSGQLKLYACDGDTSCIADFGRASATFDYVVVAAAGNTLGGNER